MSEIEIQNQKSSTGNYFFKNTTFLASYPSVKDCPSDGIPVVAFLGRSNSGKSSLLSTLCDHKNLARISSTPGKTRLLNYYGIKVQKNKDPNPDFYFVDLPGYGFAKVSPREKKYLRKMVDDFLIELESLELIILILDARRNLGEEEESILKFCIDNGKKIIFVRSKWDTMNRKEKETALKKWKNSVFYSEMISISATKKINIKKLSEKIREELGFTE